MKQVIVMRTDLNMRKGKMIAQGAHASVAPFLVGDEFWEIVDPMVSEWVQYHAQKKICVGIKSEEELNALMEAAGESGIPFYPIIDHGYTEFKGVPTLTCCSLGPWDDEEIDKITGDLKLL